LPTAASAEVGPPPLPYLAPHSPPAGKSDGVSGRLRPHAAERGSPHPHLLLPSAGETPPRAKEYSDSYKSIGGEGHSVPAYMIPECMVSHFSVETGDLLSHEDAKGTRA